MKKKFIFFQKKLGSLKTSIIFAALFTYEFILKVWWR